MRIRFWLIAPLCATVLLSACGSGDTPELMNLRSTSDGPDEFAILPPKSLELPGDLAALPQPTPGGANLTDPNPKADAIAALGGKPAKPAAGVPASDSVLLAYASRNGVTSDIRTLVAAEDLDWRRRHQGRPLERLFGTNTYFRAYRNFQLDQFAELQRWRALGLATPSAPPPIRGEN